MNARPSKTHKFSDRINQMEISNFTTGDVMAKATGFGDRLRVIREEQGWSLDELAERSGVHRQSIWKMERQHRDPAWSTVLALAAALGVTPNDFVYRADGE